MKRFFGLTFMAVATVSQIIAAPPAPKVDPAIPTLTALAVTQNSITVRVTPDPIHGAPAGFNLQWHEMVDGLPPLEDFNCAFNRNNAISAGGYFDVVIQPSLEPNACFDLKGCTDYQFRVFAKGNGSYNSTDKSTPITVTTLCEPTCTYSQGYWKNHEEAWPVASLMLGTVTYQQEDLVKILEEPVVGNGLVSLAKQLIAAKLNKENGSDTAIVDATIAAADSLIGGLVIEPIGSDSLPTSSTSAYGDILDSYNKGLTGPGHCPEVL